MATQQFGKGRFGVAQFVKSHQWTKQTDSIAETWSKRGKLGVK